MEQTFSDYMVTGRTNPNGSYVLATIAGFAAAVFGAFIWICFHFITGWYPGPVSLLVAVMVGLSIHLSGQGSHFTFGVLGVLLTFAGCLAGEIGVALISAMTVQFDIFGVLNHVQLEAMVMAIIYQAPMWMQVVYGISAIMAYNLSLKK